MVRDNQATPPALKPSRSWRLRGFLLGIVIFACGGLVGSLITTHLLWKHFLDDVGRPPRMTERMVGHMMHELDLTDEQADRIRAIMMTRSRQLHEARLQTREMMEGQLDSLRAEVIAVLSAEQAEQWQERFETVRELWRPPFPEHPRRPFGPPKGRRGRMLRDSVVNER